MKMKFCLFAGVSLLLCSCAVGSRERPLNTIPEYGHQAKTEAQKIADEEFLREAQKYPDAKDKMAQQGWAFLARNDLANAVRRFNQSWLIDSTCFQPYWGFAAAEGRLGNMESSKHYYEKALELGGDKMEINPEYAIVLRELAKSSKDAVKLQEANDLFESEIKAGNEKAACIYAFQLYRDGKKDEVCRVMESCPTDRDGLKQKAGCN